MKRLKKWGFWGERYSCAGCGERVGYLDDFCGRCGEAIEWERCPHCGRIIEMMKGDFCKDCGTAPIRRKVKK